MHITISEIMKCGVQEVRDLPFFKCIGLIKAYGQIHKSTSTKKEDEEIIDADDPANQDKIDKMLSR